MSEPRHQRLADIERELARLRYRRDIAMAAFRFPEAAALAPSIAALETERHALAASLPPAPEPPTGVTPALLRRHRRR